MLKVYKYRMGLEDVTDNTCLVGHFGFRLMDENEVQNKKETLTWDEVFSRKNELHHVKNQHLFFAHL